MHSTISRRTFLTALALFPATQARGVAAQPRSIVIHIKDMHCATCAKKIAGKLYTVPGVVKVSTDYKKGIAVIVAQPSKQPSPKALWEAVEAAKFLPVKIAGPLGTFTEKPQA